MMSLKFGNVRAKKYILMKTFFCRKVKIVYRIYNNYLYAIRCLLPGTRAYGAAKQCFVRFVRDNGNFFFFFF